MLVRFRQDVIELKPKVVVIQAGTNDLAELTGPVTEGMMGENFMSMVELAKVNGIRVVLASVTAGVRLLHQADRPSSAGKDHRAERLDQELCRAERLRLSGLLFGAGEGRNFKKELTIDGLLPNQAGYAAMAPLAEQAIAQALAGK